MSEAFQNRLMVMVNGLPDEQHIATDAKQTR